MSKIRSKKITVDGKEFNIEVQLFFSTERKMFGAKGKHKVTVTSDYNQYRKEHFIEFLIAEKDFDLEGALKNIEQGIAVDIEREKENHKTPEEILLGHLGYK